MINVPILVRDALKSGVYPKNYRVNVMSADGLTIDFTINNDNLIAETMNINERMCSGKKLKFGLCEGTDVEFQYYGYPNITDRSVWIYLDVQYRDIDNELKWYEIPMGRYDVKECSRQASTGIIKVKAYNKLLSEHLDEKVNQEIIDYVASQTQPVYLWQILDHLNAGYGNERDYTILPITGTKNEVPEPKIMDCKDPSGTTHLYGLYYGKYTFYTSDDGYMSRIRVDGKAYREIWRNRVRERLEGLFGTKDLLSWQIYGNHGWVSAEAYIDECVTEELSEIRIYHNTTYTTRYEITEDKEYISPYEIPHIWLYEIPYFARPKSDAEAIDSFMLDVVKNIRFESMHVATIETLQPLYLEWVEKFPDVTIRDLQSAVFETDCRFGRLDRTNDLFSGVELNNTRLYPADNLHPADSLYPVSMAERSTRAMYSQLWADEGNVRSFRYLIITYKGDDNNEHTLQRTINPNGTDDYNMSDNWLLKNIVWVDAWIAQIADSMVEKMRNISWFPFEMWCAGLPYLEAGDEIEIVSGENSYTSYVLSRTLKGIQNLQDTYINGELNIF